MLQLCERLQASSAQNDPASCMDFYHGLRGDGPWPRIQKKTENAYVSFLIFQIVEIFMVSFLDFDSSTHHLIGIRECDHKIDHTQ